MVARVFHALGLILTLAVGWLDPVSALAEQPETKPVTVTFAPNSDYAGADTRFLMTSPDVEFVAKPGIYQLAASVLLAHETGATDYHQSEALGGRVHVKKVFVLDSAGVRDSELFFYGTATEVLVNGQLLPAPKRLESTGWSRLHVSAGLLKDGVNVFVFRGAGQLLLEPGKAGHSYKSEDGGTTWSNRALGRNSNQEGEYLVRLRLGRHAPSGWVMTQVFGLMDQSVQPGAVLKVRTPTELLKQPAGTQLTPWLRTGSTPQPDAKSWTAWQKLDQDLVPPAGQQRHRWAQLKFELSTTKPQVSPRVPGTFSLVLETRPEQAQKVNGLLVFSQPLGSHGPNLGSVPFVYQEPSPRLELLRKRYKLDDVIAPGKTEMERLMLLRYWVRNQWHTAWGSHPQPWMPPWDAHIILESKDHADCLTMCTHYAAVFTQCCLALGWNARHCILDHHCVAEVFVNEKQRWVMMDAGNSAQRADVGLHFEDKGVPMSALELHKLYHRQRQSEGEGEKVMVCFTPKQLSDKIAHLCRPAPVSKEKYPPRPDTVGLGDLKKYPVCGLQNYRRYAMPPRNNYLSSLLPGELYQGWSEYFFDGYYWIGDARNQPSHSPEYSFHLSRSMDIDWPLNWCRIHFVQGAKAGELNIDIETFTPNLARLEMKLSSDKTGSAKDWQTTSASFTWTVHAGTNKLEVRSVNTWGKAGPATFIAADWTPGK
jgi:hypothetical protein